MFFYVFADSDVGTVEKDRRIWLQQMCQESYEQLLVEVRNRQHEFQNHLTALQGMCYSCQSLEELTQVQSRCRIKSADVKREKSVRFFLFCRIFLAQYRQIAYNLDCMRAKHICTRNKNALQKQ